MPKLLALYDQDERFAATFPDQRREELPNLVRHVDVVGHSSTVLYSRLTADTADAAIEAQMAYFASLDHDFEWKVYAHDQPPDLLTRLAAHGCTAEETEAVMVLDLRQSAPDPFASMSAVRASHETDVVRALPIVRRLRHRDDLRDVASIRQRVYGDDRQEHTDRLAYEMMHDPEYLSVYVAYVDGAPSACGWIRFPRTSAFASLWGGSTVPELRQRGVYTALLKARIDEARERGFRYLTVDAGSMSRPILEKRGFQLLTQATACTWSAAHTSTSGGDD